jgi:hypothetical protein
LQSGWVGPRAIGKGNLAPVWLSDNPGTHEEEKGDADADPCDDSRNAQEQSLHATGPATFLM